MSLFMLRIYFFLRVTFPWPTQLSMGKTLMCLKRDIKASPTLERAVWFMNFFSLRTAWKARQCSPPDVLIWTRRGMYANMCMCSCVHCKHIQTESSVNQVKHPLRFSAQAWALNNEEIKRGKKRRGGEEWMQGIVRPCESSPQKQKQLWVRTHSEERLASTHTPQHTTTITSSTTPAGKKTKELWLQFSGTWRNPWYLPCASGALARFPVL